MPEPVYQELTGDNDVADKDKEHDLRNGKIKNPFIP